MAAMTFPHFSPDQTGVCFVFLCSTKAHVDPATNTPYKNTRTRTHAHRNVQQKCKRVRTDSTKSLTMKRAKESNRAFLFCFLFFFLKNDRCCKDYNKKNENKRGMKFNIQWISKEDDCKAKTLFKR